MLRIPTSGNHAHLPAHRHAGGGRRGRWEEGDVERRELVNQTSDEARHRVSALVLIKCSHTLVLIKCTLVLIKCALVLIKCEDARR